MLDLDLGRILDLYGEFPKNLICRHESCKRPELHAPHLKREAGVGFRTRSKRHIDHPWVAQHPAILRASVYEAVSIIEPRNFTMIVQVVQNDYGSCLERSVHRHLKALRASGAIVRLDWKRIYAYLRAGSKLLNDPMLVYEQILASTRAA
jgi:hypothetical protein